MYVDVCKLFRPFSGSRRYAIEIKLRRNRETESDKAENPSRDRVCDNNYATSDQHNTVTIILMRNSRKKKKENCRGTMLGLSRAEHILIFCKTQVSRVILRAKYLLFFFSLSLSLSLLLTLHE